MINYPASYANNNGAIELLFLFLLTANRERMNGSLDAIRNLSNYINTFSGIIKNMITYLNNLEGDLYVNK